MKWMTEAVNQAKARRNGGATEVAVYNKLHVTINGILPTPHTRTSL